MHTSYASLYPMNFKISVDILAGQTDVALLLMRVGHGKPLSS